jgi:uracil-DNA glycosylase
MILFYSKLLKVMEKQTIKLDAKDVAEKLYNMIKASDSGWHDLLKGFLVSEDFVKIIKTLEDLVNDDMRFTPPLRMVFRAFTECPFDKLKVVMVGQDPYPQLGVADGIAFSCGNTGKPEASLRYIHRALAKTVYSDDSTKTLSTDLSDWSRQGVLMLNTSLTTEVGKIGKHFAIWDPFIKYLIDMLNSKSINAKKPIVWAFLGKKAQELEDLLDDSQIVLKASHPASAAYAREKMWDCNDVFNKINSELEGQGSTKITW